MPLSAEVAAAGLSSDAAPDCGWDEGCGSRGEDVRDCELPGLEMRSAGDATAKKELGWARNSLGEEEAFLAVAADVGVTEEEQWHLEKPLKKHTEHWMLMLPLFFRSKVGFCCKIITVDEQPAKKTTKGQTN